MALSTAPVVVENDFPMSPARRALIEGGILSSETEFPLDKSAASARGAEIIGGKLNDAMGEMVRRTLRQIGGAE